MGGYWSSNLGCFMFEGENPPGTLAVANADDYRRMIGYYGWLTDAALGVPPDGVERRPGAEADEQAREHK